MTTTKKITVLLADDEPHIRLLMRKVMESMNAEVVAEAKNGEEAVALYRRTKPHMAFLDITMPIMDGKAALKAIREEFPDAFVIMLTSMSAMETVKECLDAGAANYIRKDTPLNELKLYIKETWSDFQKG
ncbi:MAG: response regulator transcription factor [Desulfobulbaceae bacterium]|nr:response regulator transcription factor [Desulfobulbaceae bacterium]